MANGENQKFDEIASRNLEANIIIETQKEKLTENLAQKLGISRETTDKLIKFDTENSIDRLKQELAKIKSIDKTKYDEDSELKEIKNIIKQIQFLQKEIKSESRTKIASLNDSLKEQLESYKIVSNFPLSSKIFSPDFIKKAQNPENFSDNLAALTVGTIDSVYKLGKLPVDLLVGFVKSPIDGYKLITGKAETDSFKNV
ncbi:MAG: hypothetical protein PHR68_03390 [Candidatus Gracilibacteria bacterium]|nr:hypothetical protein [Candidatus Gracilibacteria bacterium]